VLDAAKACVARWGTSKVTIDDIALEAGVSRATLYRMFPGGREVLFDAMRVRELEEFFVGLRSAVEGVVDLEEVIVRAVVHATRQLRDDDVLALMLAAEPGEALSHLTVDGLPRIIRMGTVFLSPLIEPHVGRHEAARLVDVLARLVLSFFLAPSAHIDLGDPDAARGFLRSFVLTSYVLSSSLDRPTHLQEIQQQ
jgi:AcrR family transcriptional regulator